jgi:hypothetical protein
MIRHPVWSPASHETPPVYTYIYDHIAKHCRVNEISGRTIENVGPVFAL